MKKSIILSILVVVAIFAIGYFYLSQGKNLTESRIHPVSEEGSRNSLYDELVNECKNKEGESCCLASAEAMKINGYTLVPREGCPSGYRSNMMRCVDSYRWCQPIADSNDAEANKDTSPDNISSELRKLNIQITGSAKSIELTLPQTLSDANWGMKQVVCREGGYDLASYAGKTLFFTYYPTNEVWNNSEPLNVWIVTIGDKIACVYKAVGENSQVALGIFSIKQNASIHKR